MTISVISAMYTDTLSKKYTLDIFMVFADYSYWLKIKTICLNLAEILSIFCQTINIVFNLRTTVLCKVIIWFFLSNDLGYIHSIGSNSLTILWIKASWLDVPQLNASNGPNGYYLPSLLLLYLFHITQIAKTELENCYLYCYTMFFK